MKKPTGEGTTSLDKKKQAIIKACDRYKEALISEAEVEAREERVLRDRPKVRKEVQLARQDLMTIKI